MPLLHKHTSPLWGIWKIEESWQEIYERLDRKEEYRLFVESSKSETRKSEWLAVRILLKELLGFEALIAYQENGVPYLLGSDLHISISHTKGYAAVLISPDKPVGIDIEFRSNRVERIQNRFLNEKELELLSSSIETIELLICWSAKETAFKMMSQQTADLQKDIHIIEFDWRQKDSGHILLQESLTSIKQPLLIKYQITEDFIVTHSG